MSLDRMEKPDQMKRIIGDRKRLPLACLKAFMVLMIVIQIALILLTCRYSFFTADDYWHAVTAGGLQSSLGELWRTSWNFMAYRYSEWQGTYLSMFLQIFLCPLNFTDSQIYLSLHIILVVVCGLFFLSLYGAVRAFVRWMEGEAYSAWHTIGLYALFLTTFLNLRSYEENFYWFSGATSYTIPVILAVDGMLILLHCSSKSLAGTKRRMGQMARTAAVLISSLLLFLACGGSLEVALPVCYELFVLIVYWIARTARNRRGHYAGDRHDGAHHDEKERMLLLFPIAAAYVGTLINGLAPGNYVRHAVTAESESAVKALYHAVLNSLFQLFDESGKLLDSSVLCVMFLLTVVAGIIMSERLRGGSRRLWRLILIQLPLPFLEIFPVIMGYGSVGLPGRTYLILYLSFTAIILSVGLAVGRWLTDIWTTQNRKRLLSVVLLMSIVAAMTDDVCMYRTYEGDAMQQAPMSVLAMDWQKGWTQQYYQDVLAFYEKIQTSDASDVTVDVGDLLNAPDGLMSLIVLNADCVAQYYGKASVTVVYEE